MNSAALSEELSLVHRHTVNLAERFRHLLMMARSGGANRDQLLATVMEDFSSALEELRIAGEELQAQQEALSGLNASLEEHRSYYHHLFELLPEAALITTPTGQIQEANTAALALFRQPLARLTGKPLAALVPRTHITDVITMTNQAAAGPDGSVVTRQTCIRRYDGRLEELPVECRVSPVGGRQGQITRLHWLIRPLESAPLPLPFTVLATSEPEPKQMRKDLNGTRRSG